MKYKKLLCKYNKYMFRKQFFDVLNMPFKINVNIILNGDFSNFYRQFINLL